ncbi:receptor-type tyrosine-protein phosphatase F-like [Limulus polyphemus]|uniref:protein-tyrosine-phosphatase n=1 Tax=Limulus polyphemus TaxID=6850 RepID=A0ABM1SP99_LIMPO|nr:receptor-type tyrosine-protein phosphatase F-like [Limulus polyphemus]
MKNQKLFRKFGRRWEYSTLESLLLLMFLSTAASLNILKHEADPPLVANCSTTILTCHLDTPAPESDVWWTFNGDNASKLPNVTIVTEQADDGIWKLQLACPTLKHAGKYMCNAQSRNESGLAYRKEATVNVYVPLTIKAENKVTIQLVNEHVTLSCDVLAYPRATLRWEKDGQKINQDSDHFRINTTNVGVDTVRGTVLIEHLRRSDNGSYICVASNKYNMSTEAQHVRVDEPPEISLDEIKAEDSRTVSLKWHTTFTGNSLITRFHLRVKNYSTGSDWMDVDNNISTNITSYTVRLLAPAMTYGFQIAAINSVGRSDWQNENITMPPDVPPKVSQIHVFASTNQTLLFGWKRPTHDNGAVITHYILQLKHKGKLVANEILNGTSRQKDNQTDSTFKNRRSNYMYLFGNLNPGETYAFRVKACNSIGCGNWSNLVEEKTSDGMADPPEHVEAKCSFDSKNKRNYVSVTWEPPIKARGIIESYNVTLEGESRFKNSNGKIAVDRFRTTHSVKPERLEFRSAVKPNTNYTVRMCTNNRSGCGTLSVPTTLTFCSTSPLAPTKLPPFRLQNMKESNEKRHLVLKLQRVSERNGSIKCYRIIVIKMKPGAHLSSLPPEPSSIELSTYRIVHWENGHGAYLAEAFTSEHFVNEIIIGDGRYSICDKYPNHSTRGEGQSKRATLQGEVQQTTAEYESIYDGELSPSTNYTGYVELQITGPNGTVLSKQSPYFSLIETGSTPKPEPVESLMTIILGIICGLVLLVLVFVLVQCVVRKKNNHLYEEEGDRIGLTALIRRTIQRNGHVPKGNRLSKLSYVGPLLADDLPSAYVEKHKDNNLFFQKEFESLPEKFKDRTTHASDSPENLCKNRYPDVKAFDQTRVQLPIEDGIKGSDYINANFVEGYRGRKMFICAQGPLEHTVVDFWKMMWEHKVTVVVMLTGVEEHGKLKCAQYWSDDDPKEVEKLYTVNVINTTKYSDYLVRRFQVQHKKDGFTDEREILQFHFVMWKDFLAPEQPSWLLRFIKRVNEHYVSDRGPLLVHCSAGVGRTGTFVAIDTLLQELNDEGQVNVYACVSDLRHSRNYLVQSLKQYIFVYRALMEYAQFGDTEIEMRHLRDHFAQLRGKMNKYETTGLQLEFKKLGDVIEDPKTCCVGTMDINLSKNRYNFIIPYDTNRVILPPTASRDHSSYINASFIEGYNRSLSFIITQDPLENTQVEFWRMIKEHNIQTVVMLSELGEGQTKCPQYWPTEEQEYDYIKVTFQKEEKTDLFIKREFNVTNVKNNDNHVVTHYQFLRWSDSGNPSAVPESTVNLIELIEEVQLTQALDFTNSPLTVHCSGGGDRSSVYITLSVLIQQLKLEERVDVFQAARHTRSQRQCMLQTIGQYDFLYRGLLDYMHHHKLMDMGDTPL